MLEDYTDRIIKLAMSKSIPHRMIRTAVKGLLEDIYREGRRDGYEEAGRACTCHCADICKG